VEELLFRGYGFERLIKGLGHWPAQRATALLFAAFHVANGWPWQVALMGTTVGSLLFGLVFDGNGPTSDTGRERPLVLRRSRTPPRTGSPGHKLSIATGAQGLAEHSEGRRPIETASAVQAARKTPSMMIIEPSRSVSVHGRGERGRAGCSCWADR
jgi:hypothetical protein